jgi:hypothetical protein
VGRPTGHLISREISPAVGPTAGNATPIGDRPGLVNGTSAERSRRVRQNRYRATLMRVTVREPLAVASDFAESALAGVGHS